jgi:SagB-type dehydrogenase family enzyme
MDLLYETTSLTKKNVASFGGYIDWHSQPSIFKHYPEFLFRYRFGENEQLCIPELFRTITSREYIASNPYYKLNTPSAGNLHPIELYLQIRAVKGIISGIYHVDAKEGVFTLVQEIEQDGLETTLGLSYKYNGIIAIVSCVPFRSEWKYGKRAVRYCYLDLGHQIGSIKAAATIYDQETTILSDFSADELNHVMGFKDEEFACAVIALGTLTQKEVKPLSKKLLHVMPTDYSDSSGELAEFFSQQRVFKSDIYPISSTKTSIYNRRSARKFEDKRMENPDFEHLMHILGKSSYPLSCYVVLFNDNFTDAGVYLNDTSVKKGVFTDLFIEMIVDQRFIKNAQMLVILSAKDFDANNLMLAGMLTHKLYLEAEDRDVKCTGIGAFYDKKLQEFLGTQNYILYVCALGK